jgi:hypothetical protein
MGISQTTSAIMIFLTGLLPAGCHKTAPQQKSAPPAAALATTNGVISNHRNLGEISLTNHSDTCFRLATGESCTLTPKLLDRHNVQITFALESRNDYGETHNFAVTQVIAEPGKPAEVAVGDLNFTFTPRVSQEQ